MRRGIVLALSLSCLASPAAAQSGGDTDDERAALHFRAGTSYFSEESFEEALEEFRAAHRLSGRPEMLYNIGLTLERLGRWAEASEAYAEFLERVPDGPDSDEARTRLERARARAARQEPEAPATDPATDPATEPGDLPAEPEPEPDGDGPRLLPWVVLGGSVAVGAVALGTGLAAHGIHGDLDEVCGGGVCPADRAGDIDRGRALARASTALTFLAAAGAVAGVVLLIVGGDDERDDERVRLEVAPTRGGGYVQGRLVF